MQGQRAQSDVQGRAALEKWVLACAAGVFYYALALGSTALSRGPANASAMWLPSGFAVAAAVLWGPSAAAGVFFGAWLADERAFLAEHDLPLAAELGVSGLVALGAALQAKWGAALLRRFAPPEDALTRSGAAGAFVLLALLIGMISTSIELLAVAAGGVPAGYRTAQAALNWWIGDSVGILVAAPLVLAWARPRAAPAVPTLARAAEGLAAAVLIAASVAVCFGARDAWRIWHEPLWFVTLPPMLWVSWRFGPRAQTASLAALAVALTWLSSRGAAVRFGADAPAAILVSSAYLSALAVTMILTRALLHERDAAMKDMAEDRRAARLRLELDQRTFAHLPIGIAVLRLMKPGDPRSLRIVEINPAGLRLARAAGEQAAGAPLSEFSPEMYDSEFPGTCLEVLRTGESRTIPGFRSSRRVPGAYFDLVLFPLGDTDVGVAYQDVSAQRKAQVMLQENAALLLLMIESVRDYAIFRLDEAGVVSSWSQGAELIYGYAPAEILGSPYSRFFPPADDAARALAEQMSAVAREGRTKTENWCVRKDGTRFWADIVLTALREEAGPMIGCVAVVRDATMRRKSELKLSDQSAALTRSNVELTQFAYVASHDLNAPLHKVRAFADRLEKKLEGSLDEEGHDYLRRMMRAIAGMQNLIDGLLELARVTTRAGGAEVVDLGALANDVVEGLDLVHAHGGARVEIGALPKINADPLQMRQLLQNLIANALKFQRPGARPRVRVSGKATDDGRCELVVADNGIGFDMKYAERIFQPFQRLNSRFEFEGSGMGLAICQKIVARHGGSISATSKPEHGTEFKVILPVSQEGRMECLRLEKASR